MKMLARVLGVIAFVGSLAVAMSWVGAWWGERTAITSGRKAVEVMEEWQSIVRRERRNDKARVEIGEKDIENDNLDLQIAQLQGRPKSEILARRRVHADQLVMARAVVASDQALEDLGEDDRVAAARERVEACANSLRVYTAVAARDEKLAYALGVIWLAFGFAMALASREPAAPVPA